VNKKNQNVNKPKLHWNNFLRVRLSPFLRAIIQGSAENSGQTTSEFVRGALKDYLKEHPDLNRDRLIEHLQEETRQMDDPKLIGSLVAEVSAFFDIDFKHAQELLKLKTKDVAIRQGA